MQGLEGKKDIWIFREEHKTSTTQHEIHKLGFPLLWQRELIKIESYMTVPNCQKSKYIYNLSFAMELQIKKFREKLFSTIFCKL